MVASFRDRETERLWHTGNSRRLPASLHRPAFKKLSVLNAALTLSNWRVPPGNQLEALRGRRAGQHSIRVNDHIGCISSGETETLLKWRSSTTIRTGMTMKKPRKIFAVHPGEILKTEFMQPMGITSYALAKALDFPGIYEVVRGERALSADTAIRLGKYFGLPAQFWLNLQNDYDLRLAQRRGIGSAIKPLTLDGRRELANR